MIVLDPLVGFVATEIVIVYDNVRKNHFWIKESLGILFETIFPHIKICHIRICLHKNAYKMFLSDLFLAHATCSCFHTSKKDSQYFDAGIFP